MAHLHKVYDSDTHFKIDATSRTVINESDIKKIMLIQNDHNSERFTFELPRYIEEHDMTLCDVVEIHYINTDSKTKESMKDVYIVDDLQAYPDDENVVVLSWLLSRNATKYVGNLSFLICFKCLDGTEIEYMWSTAIYSKITVGTSIYNSEQIVEEFSDVLQAWKDSLLNVAYDAAALVDQSVDKYMTENPVVVEMQATDETIQYSMGDDNWKDIIPISDLKGEKGDTGEQGIQGESGIDGISPTATIEQFEGGAKITVTDANGTTEANIYDGGGENGIDGIGITNIEQTTKSEEDDGDNVISITLSDGSVHTFTVQNGSRGTDGIIGADGKSAYEAAQEAGYSGTEEEFASGMAAMDNLPSAGVKISGILPAGETEITLTSDEIKEDSRLDVVYTSIFGVPVQSAEFEAGGITLIFPAQEEDMTVAALFDATVANGEDGEDGAPGADGKDGENGQDGAPGKSAYAYAQEAGYSGTEEEFAEMLANGGSGDYMSATDPVGTGSFSMNRAANTTVGENSSVLGENCIATGAASHAEGYGCQATYAYAHAEGRNTHAEMTQAHAEGYGTYAKGICSHAEGCETQANSHYTHAEGLKTTAGMSASHAEGESTTTWGDAAHAEGYSTYAQNKASHAEGIGTMAIQEAQHAQGKWNMADTENTYAHIVGNGESDTVRSNAHTLDWDGNAWFAGDVTATDSSGNSVSLLSLANGGSGGDYLPLTDPSGTGSFSMNRKADTDIGAYSTTLGFGNTASAEWAFAEGNNTTASNLAAHSEGYETKATDAYSHAEGYGSEASGPQAHAEGYWTVAKGASSHAEGTNTIASGLSQHAQGRFNIEDTSNTYAHIVGNGESDATRSNAHTLDWNGNAWFAGDVTATGANGKSVNLLSALTSGDVVNNLTSTATNVPLSAYQGKLLKEQIANAGGSKWTLVLNNDTSSKVDMTNYSEIRVYVYGKAKDSVCRYSMSHDFLIDELLSQESYFATIPGNIGYGDDFDNAFIDFYPTTSKRSFGVGYVDARFGGEYCSDATFKIYAR